MTKRFSFFSSQTSGARLTARCGKAALFSGALTLAYLNAPLIVNAQEVEDTGVSQGEEEATQKLQGAVNRIFEEPLGGVVVNRTVTVLGKEFYRYFSTHWSQNPDAARYSISVYERPTARFGSEIWVLYRQQRMFHAFLPPARQASRGMSEIAVHQVLENISHRELERLTTRNPDLGPEEL